MISGNCACCGTYLWDVWSILCECKCIFHICHKCYISSDRFSDFDKKKGIIRGECNACLRDKKIGEL